MSSSRESIFVALFTLLQGMNSIKQFSRRFITFDRVSSSAAMPYLILCSTKEEYPAREITSLPPARQISAEIFIYISVGQNQGQNVIPDSTVNAILDELDSVMTPIPPREVQTLGGLVDHCYIEGEITKVPGDLDGIGVIHIPLKIVIP